MIKTKDDLKEYIDYEKKLYYGGDKGSKMHAFLIGSKFYKTQKYLEILRKAEYHKNNSGIFHKLMFACYHRKKHILGQRIGYEIPENVAGKGIMIYHCSPVIINEKAKIGEDIKISGMFCVGHKRPGEPAPRIGNNVTVGWGCTVLGDVDIADDCVLGANSTVVYSIATPGAHVAGSPAKEI